MIHVGSAMNVHYLSNCSESRCKVFEVVCQLKIEMGTPVVLKNVNMGSSLFRMDTVRLAWWE